MMRKLRWWQWCLVVFLGIPTLGAAVELLSGNEDVTAGSSKPEFKPLSRDAVFAMLVDPDVQPDSLLGLAREHCADRQYCNVLTWTDSSHAARGFPLTDREAGEVRFQYTINRATGFERARWDCATWAIPDESNCPSANNRD